jgi:hypothetical protein
VTAYTIDFDATLDAAIESARAANEPDLTAGEYLAIVLTPYLTNFCRDHDSTAVEVSVKAAKEAVQDKYKDVTDAVSAQRKEAFEAAKLDEVK